MPYIYPNVFALHGNPKLEDEECVALIRHYTSAPPSSAWKQGAEVMGNKSLRPGTAIATFEKGRYPSRPDHKHTAFYLSQLRTGIWVIDQWPGPKKRTISKRFIGRREIWDDGTYDRPSDNCFAFSVIE
jgi:hypothetical protein